MPTSRSREVPIRNSEQLPDNETATIDAGIETCRDEIAGLSSEITALQQFLNLLNQIGDNQPAEADQPQIVSQDHAIVDCDSVQTLYRKVVFRKLRETYNEQMQRYLAEEFDRDVVRFLYNNESLTPMAFRVLLRRGHRQIHSRQGLVNSIETEIDRLEDFKTELVTV